MPFVSDAQRRWGHTAEGRAALGNKLAEFDAATKGKKLPERITPKAVKRPRKVPGVFGGPPPPPAAPRVKGVSPLARLLGLK